MERLSRFDRLCPVAMFLVGVRKNQRIFMKLTTNMTCDKYKTCIGTGRAATPPGMIGAHGHAHSTRSAAVH